MGLTNVPGLFLFRAGVAAARQGRRNGPRSHWEASMTRSLVVFAGAAAMLGALSVATPVHALTMKECSAKYQAARAGNHLDGMKWNEFRKAQCGTSAAVVSSAAPA